MLYIELLGQIRISWGEHRYAIALKRQSLVLLAHFALARTHREAREVLIEKFWPETEPEKGHSNLSSALSRLRRALRPADPGIITLDAYGQAGIAAAAAVWFDADTFRTGVRPALASPGRLPDTAAAELCHGLALYRGELLDGFFDDWILAEREQLRALYIRGQLRLLDHFIAGGEVEAAIECGREVLRLDPLRESLHRRMMALYAGNGEPAAARRQFARLVQLLKEELGVAPGGGDPGDLPAPLTLADLRLAPLLAPATGADDGCCFDFPYRGDRAVTRRSSRRDAGASPGCGGGDGRVAAG